MSDCQPQFYVRTTYVAGSLDLGEVTLVHADDTVDVTVELRRPVAMESAWASPSARAAAPSLPAS